MPDEYQIIFNSQGGNVVNKTSINDVVYTVNWTAFLDIKYKKFKCTFNFKSENTDNELANNGFVSMNFGRSSIYDGLQMSNNLGVIYPAYLNNVDNSSYYTASTSDNNEFYIDYPTNSVVTVSLKTFGGGDVADMPEYVIMLSLTGIEE